MAEQRTGGLHMRGCACCNGLSRRQFTTGLAAGGRFSGASDQVVFSGSNDKAHSLWKVVDNNGAKHRQ